MSLRAALAGILAACALAGSAFAAPSLADYGKLPAVEELRLSPNGEKIAYLAVAGDDRRLMITPVGGGPRIAMKVGALRLRSVLWLDDGHVLVDTRDTVDNSGNPGVKKTFEATQSIIVDADTGKTRVVFADSALIYPATFGLFGVGQEGAAHFGYFAGITLTGAGSAVGPEDVHQHGKRFDLYKVNLDSGRSEKLADGVQHHGMSWAVNNKGVVVAHTDYDPQSHQWRLYAGADDAVLIASETNTANGAYLDGLGRTDDSVLVLKPDFRANGYRYFEYPLTAGAKATELFTDRPFRSTWRSSATGLLLGATKGPPDPRAVMFDPALGAKFDKVKGALSGELVTPLDATDSFDRQIVYSEGPGDSGTYFLVDLRAGSVHAIGWAYPTILQADVAPFKTFAYKAADGLAMEGVLTLPVGRPAKNAPLIVLPHWGDTDRIIPGFDWWAQAYASRGYAVFRPNFRGSGGYGQAFLDAGNGEWGRKRQTDISDGVAELARQGVVDPKRVCIVGAGFGGYPALAGVTVQQGLYRCAIAIGGLADMNDSLAYTAKRFGEDSEYMRFARRMFGAREDNDSALDTYSPRLLAAKADAPILLIYTKEDSVIDIAQSRNMADALRKAGKSVEVLPLEGDDHWLQKAATRTAVLEASLAFVEKYNPSEAVAN